MPTFTADLAAAGVPARYQEKGVFPVVSTYEASALGTSDRVQMCKVQSGVTVIDAVVYFDQLNASTITVDVGIDGADDKFIAGVSAATAGAGRMTKFPFTFTADDTIDVTVNTNAATGTITLVVYMTAEEVDLA
jgi:hypothetical protein